MANDGETYSMSQLEATWTELGLFLKVLPREFAGVRSSCKCLVGADVPLPEQSMWILEQPVQCCSQCPLQAGYTASKVSNLGPVRVGPGQ